MIPAKIPGHIEAGGRIVPVELNHSVRARRISITADSARGLVRLTVPKRASMAKAAAFFADRQGWLEEKVAAYPARRPFENGMRFPFEDKALEIRHDVSLARMPIRDGDLLMLGGPAAYVPARVERWLRGEALAKLKADAAAAADRGGLGNRLGRISVRDTRRQWGSCTVRNGNISFSWRLILAPVMVRRAVAAHEVAHLVHRGHGKAFHALADELAGGTQSESDAWLRAHGSALHGIGRQ